MKSKALLLGLAMLASGPVLALEVGDPAPCVVLDGVDANRNPTHGCIRDTVSPKHTHTIIDFFSIHCSTCKANMPKVKSLADEVADVATVRYVSVDRNAEDVKKFVSNSQFSQFLKLPVAFDVEREARAAYQVAGTPTMFILDKNFKIVYKHAGALSDADLHHIKRIVRGQ